MALQGIGSNLIGSGLQVNLGSTDSAYIAANVLVSSSDYYAIYGSGSGRAVFVDGAVISPTYAIQLGDNPATDNGQKVVIGETGSIKSFSNSVGNAVVWVYGFNSVVDNRGSIWSLDHGIYMNGEAAGNTSKVLNSGTIEAAARAIWHGTDAAETLVITNSGTIKGEAFAIYSSSSDPASIEKITNTGNIVGDIYLAAGNDVYEGGNGRLSGTVSSDVGNDLLRGGIDNDTFNGGSDNDKLYGGKGNDKLNGDAGTDSLQGDDGNDVLNGGAGIDTLYGGTGKDILTGGTEKDTFIFKSIADSTVADAGRDLIKDFSRSDAEKIDLKLIDASTKATGDQAFTFIATQAFHKVAGELRYEIKSGDTYIYGDVNGDGTADFSIRLDLSLAMKETDFIL